MDGRDAINYVIDNNIEGAICECGVDAGYFESIWIDELMKRNTTRDIYLYDTFGGLTIPGDYDYTRDDAKLYKMDKKQVHTFWKDRIVDCEWDVGDLWYNHIFAKYPVKRYTTNKMYSNQTEGFSLLDQTIKTWNV